MPLSNNGYKNKNNNTNIVWIVNVEYICIIDDRFVKKVAGQIIVFPDKSSIYGHVRIHESMMYNT